MPGQFLHGDAPPIPSLPSGHSATDAQAVEPAWVDSFEDELTMAIATKSWEEAVAQVDKGKDAPTCNRR
jgi:hypothetical protein